MIYGYDPIFLEKKEVNEWLKEDEDNILLVIEDSNDQVNLSKSFLKKNDVKFSALDSEILLAKALKKQRKYLILNLDKPLSKKNLEIYNLTYK